VRGKVWIAGLSISPRTRAKIAGRHGLDVDDLRAHLVGIAGLGGSWQDHPERGRRALLEVPFHGRRILVVLYPAPDLGEDVFRLGSAYEIA
jgi:hypothetical protein